MKMIKCSERLPPEKKKICFKLKGGKEYSGYFCKSFFTMMSVFSDSCIKLPAFLSEPFLFNEHQVLAWAELPEGDEEL